MYFHFRLRTQISFISYVTRIHKATPAENNKTLCPLSRFCFLNFIPVTEISVAKTEISETGSARLLNRTHRNFYEGKSAGQHLGNRSSSVNGAYLKRFSANIFQVLSANIPLFHIFTKVILNSDLRFCIRQLVEIHLPITIQAVASLSP